MKAVNLLPSEQRGSAKTAAASAAKPDKGAAPFGAYVVLGALAFAVVATALSVLAGNTIKDRKADLARVTAEAQATQAKATSLQSYADFATLAGQRVQTVRSLAASRFDWQRTLDDLAKALPSDVHLRGIDASTQTGTGASSSGLRSSIQAPAITLTGCTRTQTSVARLMSRLRNVRGVTRVPLAQSEKTAGATAAPTPGEASLCPKGSPPEFDMTMFFERATLPAASTVNATAAGTTTTSTATAPATASTAATDASGAAPAGTTAAATATPAAGAAATPAATTATTTTSTGTTK